jgi:plasmid stabilization system protein ParE
MEIKIIWSDESIKTFDDNIDYLNAFWSRREVSKFLKQVDYVISRLQEFPESFNPSLKNKRIRRARINSYITLYYRYNKLQNKIILLSFWNVKQDPSKIQY